jgi:GT2 family glycosyltransferase
MPAPRVAVAVLQRESFGHTKRSLENLYATAGEPFDLVYVDGGSPPRVRKIIEDEAQRRGFRIIRRDRFLMPNEARNLAVATVDAEFMAFVDNDLIFRPGWLRQLLACADETKADITFPLVFMEEPPFRRIHFAGGEARIEATASGRYLRNAHRFTGHYVTPAIAAQFIRTASQMFELHCALVRRSALERLGPFDEGVRTVNEHIDLSLLASLRGCTAMFEPAAVANHLLPKGFPFDIESVPFLLERCRPSKNHAGTQYFRAKWRLAPDDPVTEATRNWSDDRPLVIVRALHPRIAAHAMRKLSRILKRCFRKIAGRVAVGA